MDLFQYGINILLLICSVHIVPVINADNTRPALLEKLIIYQQ